MLTYIQQTHFNYMWEGAEPTSGLARERIHMDGEYPQNDADVVTTGGSGFGIAGLLVAIDRGFITREAGVQRLHKIADYLARADRFHGVWPHWIDGPSGKVKPFGQKDNGGDLVESSFLMTGLLCARQYFRDGNETEKALAAKIDTLWREMEWSWYQNGQDVLYWHWSPEYNWEMNFPLEGYNECLITYVLAAASPDYAIDYDTYNKGWTRNGTYTTDRTKYGLPLYVKHNYAEECGGPLFWSQYSYLGLDPRGLSDKYVKSYWDLNRNQVLIDYKYCVENPLKFNGYSEKYWGLTAGYTRNKDGTTGYAAHQPMKEDLGVIVPTAALSSMPYTPKESMDFLRFLYQEKPDFIGKAGPYDATSIHYDNWFTPRYLAIDQGTIAPMIENYRSGLLWDLFMSAPEVRSGLKKIGFKSEKHKID
jgi:hypothetical protein